MYLYSEHKLNPKTKEEKRCPNEHDISLQSKPIFSAHGIHVGNIYRIVMESEGPMMMMMMMIREWHLY